MSKTLVPIAVAALAAAAVAPSAVAQERELTLYSTRHYQTDERLYAHFTKKTGIKVSRVDGSEDELLERLRKEGSSSPADVFITVDAARLSEADALGLFMPVRSSVLEQRIPPRLRTDTWFAFSTRARIIVYDRAKLAASDVPTYEDLASPKLKGKVCVRSGSHPYNVSLGAALIAHLGEARTEEWARGLVANLAREPKGGDTDQIRAVGAGVCRVALVNSYYVARLVRSAKAEDQELMRRVGVVWPDQHGHGTHVNVSGGGVLATAPHKEAALKFLEYLASDGAQAYFAEGNNEWPVVRTAVVRNDALDAFGAFKADVLNVSTLSRNTALARKIFERAGWR